MKRLMSHNYFQRCFRFPCAYHVEPCQALLILAARGPVIHNATVASLSQLLLHHFCHHPFSAFYSVVHQPSSAGTNNLCRISIPIQIYKIDIREDANSHKVILCKHLS